MAVNFLDPETTFLNSGRLEKIAGLLSENENPPVIRKSSDVTGMELRMLPPFIKDNRTEKIFPFPGYAKLYCLTIVVSDVNSQLAGSIDLKGFPRIDDKENLPVNKSVFYWQARNQKDTGPDQIHIMCAVLKSKKGLRDSAAILAGLKEDKEYNTLIGSLGKLAKNAASFNPVVEIITGVAGLVGKKLKDIEDKPLGTIFNSYTTLFGDFDKLGVTELTYPTRYVDFNFKLVVRNKKAVADDNDESGVEMASL